MAQGTQLTLEAEGTDAQEAVDALAEVVEKQRVKTRAKHLRLQRNMTATRNQEMNAGRLNVEMSTDLFPR